jgi:hypothetical protein
MGFPTRRKAAVETYAQAMHKQEQAQAIGEAMRFPCLEAALHDGAVLKFYDRTNAVFYVALGTEGETGSMSTDGGSQLAVTPRAMRLLTAMAEIEQQLACQPALDAPEMMTGAPAEHDAIEGYLLHSRSMTGRVSFDGSYKAEFSTHEHIVAFTVRAATLQALYALCVQQGEAMRAERAKSYGEAKLIPYRLPSFMGSNEAERLAGTLEIARERAGDMWVVDQLLRGIGVESAPAPTDHVQELRDQVAGVIDAIRHGHDDKARRLLSQ